MYELILALTALVALGLGLYAYLRTDDTFQPAVVIGVLLFAGYALWPWLLWTFGDLGRLFRGEQLTYVASLYLASILAFCLGLVNWPRGLARRTDRAPAQLAGLLKTAAFRVRLYRVALALGLGAVSVYWGALLAEGGIWGVYAQSKGFLPFRSGYLAEAQLLAFPAIAMLALARRDAPLRPVDLFLVLLFISPSLIHGVLGGRRGPLFLAILVLWLAWYLHRGYVPRLRTAVAAIAIAVAAVVVVWSQRGDVYLGSSGEFDRARVAEHVVPEQAGLTEYATGVATVLTADRFDAFYWGYRYFVTFFIRPIPRQIWPTKYQDMGADWLDRYHPEGGGWEFYETVGYLPPMGSSGGFISDIYHEFAWWTPLACYLLGLGFCAVWRRHRARGGLWTVLLVEMLILSIYIPTQSFSAWGHRFMFMGLLTWLVWRLWIRPVETAALPPPERYAS